jgi:hypothetical protein
MKEVSINVKTKPTKINPITIELYGSSERYVSLEELYAILRIPTDTIGDWARRYKTEDSYITIDDNSSRPNDRNSLRARLEACRKTNAI